MNASATATGLVRPSYRSPGQAEYVNTDKLELDLENARWNNQELRRRLGVLQAERDRAPKQVATQHQATAQLQTTVKELRATLAAEKAKRPQVKKKYAPIGRLSLNLPLREMRYGDQVVRLSKGEVQVVEQLFARPGEVLETSELAAGMIGNPSFSCVTSYIWRVRGKLESVGAQGYLPQRYGWGSGGFALVDPEVAS